MLILFFVCIAGFERTIPSFPRYTIMGSEEQGEHNIRIENATLEDDAEYQCQVGPRGLSKPIRADAQLTVLSKSMIADSPQATCRPECWTNENDVINQGCIVKVRCKAKPIGTPKFAITSGVRNQRLRLQTSEQQQQPNKRVL